MQTANHTEDMRAIIVHGKSIKNVNKLKYVGTIFKTRKNREKDNCIVLIYFSFSYPFFRSFFLSY